MSKVRAEIPPEITDFKEKFFFGLTVRQLVCGALALALAIPTALYGEKVLSISKDVVEWLVIIEACPFVAIGFLTPNNQPFEKYISNIFIYMVSVQKRKTKYIERPDIIEINNEIRNLQFEIDKQDKNRKAKEALQEKKQNKLSKRRNRTTVKKELKK